MSNIYLYSSAVDFLLDQWKDLKKKNPRFSIRAWAKRMGLGSHSTLYLSMFKNKSFAPQLVDALTTYFKFNAVEDEYFKTLILSTECKDEEELASLKEKLNFLGRKIASQPTYIYDQQIQANPLSFFILELVELIRLPNSPSKIKGLLKVDYSLEEVQTILDVLIKSGFLKISPDNYLSRDKSRYLFSEPDSINSAVKDYHEKLCALASKTIKKQTMHEREFNGITLNINLNRLPEIKAYVRNFVQDFTLMFDEPSAENGSTYQLATQVFKIADKPKDR